MTGKYSEYVVEIQQDQLLIKNLKGKVKLQFSLNIIHPFSSGSKTIVTNSTKADQSSLEEIKTAFSETNCTLKVYEMKLKIYKDKKRVRKFFLRTQEDRAALVLAIIQA